MHTVSRRAYDNRYILRIHVYMSMATYLVYCPDSSYPPWNNLFGVECPIGLAVSHTVF